MSVIRNALVYGLLVAGLVVPSVSAHADPSADLRAFVQRSATMTFPDFAPLHGKNVSPGEWTALVKFGPSLSRCLIVDLPSLSSLFGGSPNDAPYSSALQCDGARTKTTQAAMILSAIHIISPLVPGFTMKRNPSNKVSGRTSITWKNTSGLTIDFIAMSKLDYKDRDGSRLGYDISVEQLSPDTMATPTPLP